MPHERPFHMKVSNLSLSQMYYPKEKRVVPRDPKMCHIIVHGHHFKCIKCHNFSHVLFLGLPLTPIWEYWEDFFLSIV